MKEHVLLNFKDGEVSVKPAVPGAKTKVNGLPLTGERVLKNNDRLLFGECFYMSNSVRVNVLPNRKSIKICKGESCSAEGSR